MVEDRLPGLLGQGLHLQRPHDLPDGHGGVEAVRTRPGPAVKERPKPGVQIANPRFR